jgi:arylsulfatase A-like enzyme
MNSRNIGSGRVGSVAALLLWSGLTTAVIAAPAATPRGAHVLLIVWDGLRPDLVNPTDTPNLAAMRASGVDFSDHHSTYPTLTMINASSFATGAFPGRHGFYGNWIWVPQVHGRDSSDRVVDFLQPVFTEDYGILQSIDAAQGGKLFTVPTVFEVAEHAGLSVAVLGKGGPTFLQNRKGTTPFIDDRTAMPQSFAEGLARASLPLPQLWSKAYPADPPSGSVRSDNPTANGRTVTMKDGVTADPSQPDGGPFVAVNAYNARVLNEYVLPTLRPELAMMWLRNPDSTEHSFGPGSAATRQALRANDALLGDVLARLEALGLKSVTNIMVVSDHGHSHISGPLDQFPLRAIHDGVLGAIDPNGFSVSGEVRTVDLLRRAGLLAYDGMREQCNPIMSGIGADGQSIYLHKPIDAQFACKSGVQVTGDFTVPGRPPTREPYAVVAPDGGTEYYYIPSRNRDFVVRIVRFLQAHKQFGAIFIDSRRYGSVAGTLPLSAVHLANAQGRNPDLIVSFNFDANAAVSGTPGLEYTSSGGNGRGTHGSFSPRDVHNTLIASGPAFKPDFHRDELPTANIDVAPTIAAILGLKLPTADGRVLNEALRDAKSQPRLGREEVLRPTQPASGLRIAEPSDPDGKTIDAKATQYTIELHTRLVRDGGNEYRYFDTANALRY